MAKTATRKAAPADEFDIGAIDEVIHGRVRLGVVAYLTAVEVADFNTLKARLSTTDGTLSVHLRKLEEAGYIAIEKGYQGKKPITRLKMTKAGRKAFQTYLTTIAHLSELSDN